MNVKNLNPQDHIVVNACKVQINLKDGSPEPPSAEESASQAIIPTGDAPTPTSDAPTLISDAPTSTSLTPTRASLTPTPASLTPTPASLTPTPASLTPTPASLTPTPASEATTHASDAPTPTSDAPTLTPTSASNEEPSLTPSGTTDDTLSATAIDAPKRGTANVSTSSTATSIAPPMSRRVPLAPKDSGPEPPNFILLKKSVTQAVLHDQLTQQPKKLRLQDCIDQWNANLLFTAAELEKVLYIYHGLKEAGPLGLTFRDFMVSRIWNLVFRHFAAKS